MKWKGWSKRLPISKSISAAGALPESWSRVRLAEACDLVTGSTPAQRAPGNPAATIPFVKPGDLDRDNYLNEAAEYVTAQQARTARELPAETVLVSCIGNLGKRAIIGRPAICNQQINAILPSQAVLPRFVFHWVDTIRQWMEENASATTITILNKSRFSLAPLIVPPLNEQRRIVAKLDALLARIRRARDEIGDVPLLIERFRQTVLGQAYSGELTREWRGNDTYASHEPLHRVCRSFDYGSAAKSQPSGRIPVLRMGNLQRGKIDWSDLVFTSDEDEITKYQLEPKTVLFNRTNSPELVGKTAIFMGERPAIFAGYLIRIQAGERLDPEYLNWCLNSPQAREYCWSVKSDGVSQSNINAQKLGAFTVPVPPLAEQKEIVRRIESLFSRADALSVEVKAARERLDVLEQAVLAKAFRGELVPQDPNDEPASVLLERIRRERAEGESEGSSKRGRGRPRKAADVRG